jgi:predicted TIM-barrel fold metal-dependent hydrolase
LSRAEIRFAIDMMGESQVLMGSDFPIIQQIQECCEPNQRDKSDGSGEKKVLGDNARRIFRQG